MKNWLQRVPALRGFWDLEKTVLHEICVSGTVLWSPTNANSPTCTYISQNPCQWKPCQWISCKWGTPCSCKIDRFFQHLEFFCGHQKKLVCTWTFESAATSEASSAVVQRSYARTEKALSLLICALIFENQGLLQTLEKLQVPQTWIFFQVST